MLVEYCKIKTENYGSDFASKIKHRLAIKSATGKRKEVTYMKGIVVVALRMLDAIIELRSFLRVSLILLLLSSFLVQNMSHLHCFQALFIFNSIVETYILTMGPRHAIEQRVEGKRFTFKFELHLQIFMEAEASNCIS